MIGRTVRWSDMNFPEKAKSAMVDIFSDHGYHGVNDTISVVDFAKLMLKDINTEGSMLKRYKSQIVHTILWLKKYNAQEIVLDFNT